MTRVLKAQPGPGEGAGRRAAQGPCSRAGPVMAARPGAPRAGVEPVTAPAPARRAGLAWPRLPASAELATIGAGYAAYSLVRLAIRSAGRVRACSRAVAGRAAAAPNRRALPQPPRRGPPRIRRGGRVLLRACPLPGHPAGAGLAVPAQASGVPAAALGPGAGHRRRERSVLGLAGRAARFSVPGMTDILVTRDILGAAHPRGAPAW